MTETTYFTWLDGTPVGRIFLAGTTEALSFLIFDHRRSKQIPPLPQDDWEPSDKPFREVKKQLKSYFKGKLTEFDVPLAAEGTPFQKKVWAALSQIPYGTAVSYADIAADIGQPKAARAVGSANGKNPISIIVPCHRVVASGGGLGGYGGGLDAKTTLLELEDVSLVATAS